MRSASFYADLEARHRGGRALIKDRLRAYLPFVLPLASQHANSYALDLGCGRGEWLELMRENGIAAKGVDLDASMLAFCADSGLDAIQANAIEYIQSLSDQSVLAVSGFHIVEHLSFQDLYLLVTHALRVLVPGGLLILETPNPENLTVGANSFYIDPTHVRPLPWQLLTFLPEQVGFARTKHLRLQEPSAIAESRTISLNDVLTSVSPDHAVIAQASLDGIHVDILLELFSKDYGVSLNELVQRYDEQIAALSAQVAQNARQLKLITSPFRAVYRLFRSVF